MATYYAQATGNFTGNASFWNTAANGSGSTGTPGSGDICYANAKTVTVNASVDLSPGGQIRTDAGAGTTGGGFNLSANGVSIKADCFGGSTTIINSSAAAGNAVTVIGNIVASATNGQSGINHTGIGTLNITGNATAGFASANGVFNQNAGTVVITGNAFGSASATSAGANNNSTGIVTVSGTATGGGVSGSYGITNNSAGTISAGVAIGGSANGSYGLNNPSGNATVGGIQYGSTGQSPTLGLIKLVPATTNTAVFLNSTSGNSTLVPNSNYTDPGIAQVKNGTTYTYAGASLTGTLSAGGASVLRSKIIQGSA